MDVGGSWITDGFAAGQYVFVKKSGTNNNIVRALLTKVSATVLTLDGTVLVDETNVPNVTVRGAARFVTVENFGSGTITDGRYANVAGLFIDGNQPLPTIPWTSAEEIQLSHFGSSHTADGVALDGEFPTAQNLFVQKFRGIGIAHQLADGRIFDCVVRSCHVGVKLPSSDTEIRGCRLYNNRDACLWIAKDSGNCQSLNNHCYGARIACYNEGGFPFRATNDTYADAFVGYLANGASNQGVLTNCLFQHNTARDVVFTSGAIGCHLVGCVVNVQREVEGGDFVGASPAIPAYTGKVGIQIDAERCSIRGGTVELYDWAHPLHTKTGDASEAIWINADLCTVETVLVDNDGVNGSIGIRVLGARKGLKIDCTTSGFHQSSDRIIVFNTTLAQKAIDVTLRVSGITTKDIDNYVDIGVGWTGSFRVVNTATGETISFVEGTAH